MQPIRHQGKLSNKELLNLSRNQGKPNLRPIIIDGPNVAVSHGNGNAFSCRGIAICVNYFWSRGHRDVTCFVPNYRKGSKGHPPTIDQEIIYDLETQGILKITPSREVNGRNVVCYDDGFVLNLAVQNDGVIVSNDQYRDLRSKDDFRRVIDKNLLMYTFVGDLFMPPDDPCGRNGPNLDQFLSFATSHRAPPPNTIFSGNPRMQPNSWGSVKNQSRWLTSSQGESFYINKN
ncbi:ribonuclease ZC3H12A-like [Ciona intestinalis]